MCSILKWSYWPKGGELSPAAANMHNIHHQRASRGPNLKLNDIVKTKSPLDLPV